MKIIGYVGKIYSFERLGGLVARLIVKRGDKMSKRRELSIGFAVLTLALLALGCAKGDGGKCNTNTDCAQGICVNGACTTAALTCTINSDCKAWEYCNAQQCLAKSCFDSAACNGGVCVGGTCQAGNGPLPDTITPKPDQTTPPLDSVVTFDQTTSDSADATCDCQPGSACTATAPNCQVACDCDPQKACTEIAPQCTGNCTDDAQCPRKSEYCDTTAGACKKGCKNNTACPGSEACNLATHKCSGSDVSCKKSSDCKNNKICSPVVGGGVDNATLQLQCQDAAGLGGQGDPCSAGGECLSGVCDTSGFCYVACETAADCGDGWQCVATKVTVNIVTADMLACKFQPKAGQCARSSDCANNQICSIKVNDAGDGLEMVCIDAVGQTAGPEPCAKNADCDSGLCLGTGVCYKACIKNSDCKEPDQTCTQLTFTFGTEAAPKSDTVNGCNSQPINCVDDSSCQAKNPFLACAPVLPAPNTTTLIYQCRIKEGDKKPGETCADDTECLSGICLTGSTQKWCYGICNGNEDCSNSMKCYPNQIAFTFDKGTAIKTDDEYYATHACTPDQGSYATCQTDANCSNGEWCGPVPNQTRTQFEYRCLKGTGNLGPGADCASDSACRSGFCIPPSQGVPPSASNPGFCFGVCTSAQNCPGFLSSCESFDLTVHDRGTPDDDTDDITDGVMLCIPGF